MAPGGLQEGEEKVVWLWSSTWIRPWFVLSCSRQGLKHGRAWRFSKVNFGYGSTRIASTVVFCNCCWYSCSWPSSTRSHRKEPLRVSGSSIKGVDCFTPRLPRDSTLSSFPVYTKLQDFVFWRELADLFGGWHIDRVGVTTGVTLRFNVVTECACTMYKDPWIPISIVRNLASCHVLNHQIFE